MSDEKQIRSFQMAGHKLRRFEDRAIRDGEFAGSVPFMIDSGQYIPLKNYPSWMFDAHVKAGKNGLVTALEKAWADMSTDGRISFNRDPGSFFGDPQSGLSGYLRAPRVMFGESDGSTTLVPMEHPLDRLQKATVTSADGGAFNAIYGAIATIQFVQQQAAFSALGKIPYNRYGFRVVSTAAKTSSVGIAEGTTTGTGVEPTYVEIGVGLKEVEAVTEMSNRMELYSAHDDTITFGGNAQVVFSNFMQALDYDILLDFNTTKTYDVESIDRATASYAAQAALSYDTGDEDFYGVDRSGSAYWDSNCLTGSSGADRTLTLALVDSCYSAAYPYWGNDLSNKFWLTGVTTQVPWSLIEGGKQRFDQGTVTFTYANGCQPVIGQAGGFKLTHYNGWPVVLDNNVTTDTIQRLYLLDGNHIKMCIGRPIEAINGNHPLYLGSYVNRLAFYGIMELVCDMPKSCAQLRDLQ